MTARRTYLIASVGMVALALPAVLGGCLTVCYLANPLAISMTTTKEIANETSEPITVRAFYKPTGEWVTLHSVAADWLLLPAWNGPSYLLQPQEKVAIHKADDRSYMCGILIMRENGEMRFWEDIRNSAREDADDDPWRQKPIAIRAIDHLPAPPSQVLEDSTKGSPRLARWMMGYLLPIYPLLFLWCLRIRRRAILAMAG